MKRMISLLLVLCLFPVCACALDLDSFNEYAEIFGESSLDESKGISANGLTIFMGKPCNVTFSEEEGVLKRIIVDGDGASFLAYSMAAIMAFDPSSENYAANAGQLLSAFLLCRTSGESYGKISTGELLLIQKQDNGYFFTVGK